jgi:hypothetical protein
MDWHLAVDMMRTERQENLERARKEGKTLTPMRSKNAAKSANSTGEQVHENVPCGGGNGAAAGVKKSGKKSTQTIANFFRPKQP